MIPLRQTAQGVTFAVRVQPRARKNALTGTVGDALKLALTAPPVEGKANQAVIELLSDLLGVPRSSVAIIGGKTNRLKVICISGLTPAQIQQRLEQSGVG